MKIRWSVTLTISAAVLAAAAIIIYIFLPPVKDNIISSCKTDLNGDGITETLLLEDSDNNGYAEFLIIRTDKGELCRFDLKPLNPWKVQTADVDGDGKKEISIGVYKTAKFDPVMAKRPFIYNWDESGLHPKWLGSRLSRPFDDYIFYDIDNDGMDELISIELLAGGRKAVNSYKWKGFGFEGIGESRSFEDIRRLKTGADGTTGPEVDVEENGKWRHAFLSYECGELLVE